ncbi:MAG: acyl-CoA carboxylase subunit beta [Clostridia bacterium]|nr:acyl-CoA carboxylase subunit beta [Clostridia bacterium]
MGTVNKIADLQNRRALIEQGGGDAKINKQHDAKKLTARERINYLLDDGSFIETDAFVKQRCDDSAAAETDAPADGVITGYGTVDGRPVCIYAQDFTVIGGSLGEMNTKKICKIIDMAIKTGTPVIALCDSAGTRIQEGMTALSGLGDILMKNTMASGVVPQITAVMGPCAGGAAYSPALGDFVFVVEETTQMFVTGPSVISSASGKKVTMEEIGSADANFAKSGVAHFKAKDDKDCLDGIKKLLSYLPANNLEDAPYVDMGDEINRVSESLQTIVPDDTTAAYDVKEVIKQITDCGELLEVQAEYAKNIVVGFARMNGSTVGIVANQSAEKDGNLDINASEKAARFIRFCDSFNIPVITLTDAGGFVPCACQEQNGIVRHAAKLIYAYAEATVPKINVIIRKAYGSAYLAMSSKQLGTDAVYAWPTAEIAVTAPECAANIIFNDEIADSDKPVETRNEMIEKYKEKAASPYEAAKYGYVDDIIEPDSTRPRIIAALEMMASKRETRPGKKHGNIPM